MDLDQEKNEKFLKLVERYQTQLDEMGYVFYDLDTPTLNGKIESTIFIFEVLRIYHLFDFSVKISEVKEYLPSLFKGGIVDGFTFLKDGVPFYIGLADVSPKEGYQVIWFGRADDIDLSRKENEIIEVFELFKNAESLRKLYHWNV